MKVYSVLHVRYCKLINGWYATVKTVTVKLSIHFVCSRCEGYIAVVVDVDVAAGA